MRSSGVGSVIRPGHGEKPFILALRRRDILLKGRKFDQEKEIWREKAIFDEFNFVKLKKCTGEVQMEFSSKLRLNSSFNEELQFTLLASE